MKPNLVILTTSDEDLLSARPALADLKALHPSQPLVLVGGTGAAGSGDLPMVDQLIRFDLSEVDRGCYRSLYRAIEERAAAIRQWDYANVYDLGNQRRGAILASLVEADQKHAARLDRDGRLWLNNSWVRYSAGLSYFRHYNRFCLADLFRFAVGSTVRSPALNRDTMVHLPPSVFSTRAMR